MRCRGDFCKVRVKTSSLSLQGFGETAVLVLFFFFNVCLLPAWAAQLVKHPSLDFGSGHDLTVRGIEPCVSLCACLEFSLSLPLCLPFPLLVHMCSLSLSK